MISNMLTIQQVVEKYPFIFKNSNHAKISLHRNMQGVRSVALKIGQRTYFPEDKLLDWVQNLTYDTVAKKKYKKK